jgi:hypothetical protein
MQYGEEGEEGKVMEGKERRAEGRAREMGKNGSRLEGMG